MNLENLYPLSPMQQGILFHTLGEPGSGVYVVQMSVELEDLSPAALRESWEEVTRRHSVLRTCFIWDEIGEPLQAVESRVELSWSEQDWRGASEAEQQRRLGEYLRADRARGFDVGQAPLMRFMLLRLGESRFQMVWSHHHLLLDGWSVPLLLSEVMRYYEGYRSGKVIRLPQPRPYADYIGWLQKQDMVKAESYWREQLGGFSAATRLGVERSDGGTGAGGIGEYTVRLSAEASARIERLAQQQRITLNTLVQGVWGLLLSRYSGQPDVIFGATTAGRPAELAGVEQMVGLFINTLPVRVQFRPGQTVLAYLQKLQEQQAEARRYEYTPLVQIQSWSEIPRGQSLFESILVFENYPVDSIEKTFREASADGLQAQRNGMFQQDSYSLTGTVVAGTELILRLTYASDLYEATTVERMAGHWLRLLEEMATDPEKRVGELEMVSDAERFQVVEEWNRTEREYPRDRGVHELFEEQVRQRPSAVAVVCGEQELSYGELNERANRLGHYLRELGVGPEVRVGLCVERSVEMVVGLLGILKAGGAYVPLDPEYPVERLGYMLEDTSAAVLLTQAELRHKLPDYGGKVVSLDEEWGEIAERSGENVSVTVSGENAAYVIYTSGSTGKPKGVVVSHRGLLNYLLWGCSIYVTGREHGALVHSQLGFDLTVTTIYIPLITGKSMLLIPERSGLEGVAKAQSQEREFDLLKLTPSHLDSLSALLTREEISDMRGVLIVGGEALAQEQLAPWRRQATELKLINEYGPTETVVGCSVYCVGSQDPEVGSVPIGRPIANTRVYVLDERMEPVGIGMRGEMYIGGAGVARGYLNRAELTAERFVPDPFASGGGRLYRTGDVGRWRADGVLEFLGRIDEQVKVRGYRIEPGEVEAVLRRQRGVRDAVVVAREGESGQKRLVGYVVGEAGASLDGVEIRRRLGERLPEYMVPSVVVELETFPLTANGKLDRRALPEPSGDRPRGGEYVAPRTAVEELLCGIWSRVLGVERVGVEDNFFSLGGHSLLATQVIARVRQVFGVEVELRRLFESPTVSGLTGVLEAAQSRGEVDKQPPLLRVEDRAELPLSYAQQRLWFIDQLEPGSVAYNIPVAVRLEGKLDEEALERTLGAIVERHEVLRTRFVVGGDGRGMQRIEERFGRVLERVDFRGLREWEQAVRMEAAEEARRGFDLGEGPLLRARLLRTGEQSHVLLLTMHHIVSDGWSTGVLIGEVGRLYEAYAQGGRAELPELAVQYGDYAVWQREWLQGEVLERQLRYWREQLSGVPVLELPTDYVRPAEASHRGGSIRVEVPSGLTEKLGELSRQEGVTLFMVLLAGFQVMLSRWSGQQDVSVGTPVANRSRTELEGLIGFFVNTLVLRTEVGGEPSVRELLGRVREVCLGAYGHQDVPFERLVEELNPERDMGHAPLFQALLALQNAPMSAIELPGLRIASLGSEAQAAKFDLELNLSESEGCIRGSFIYASDLYEATTVERMAGHWLRLLEGMATDPEKRVGELEMVSDAERFQVVEEWNRTEREYPRDRGVHELFEEQVRQRPSAVAVVCGEQELSYGELNERANRLGHYLRELGVGPEVRVGLCVERSVEMVVGLLGILKAGGAYVPLDPEYPVERLGYMLEDAGAAVLLTQTHLKNRFSTLGDSLQVLDLDAATSSWHDPARNDDQPQSAKFSPSQLAYVIYTSGSTGNPKGVAVSHANVVRLFTATDSLFQFDYEDVWSLFHTCAFDFSVWEIWGALLHGARLIILARDLARSPDDLFQLICKEKITVLSQTPSAFRQLIALQRSSQQAHSLRYVVFGGEALEVTMLRPWFEQHGSVCPRMINMYGITETTVHVTYHSLEEAAVRTMVGSPIGTRLPDLRVYVLDERMEPVGIGMRGEMYIGGAGVARGYLNRAELTAERFVPDPFASGGERLYRTGDVGRWRADGVLEFLGRIDEQVKVRGYRIEPGEVEAVLRQQRGVRDAVVVAREGESGQKRLVGYVVGEAGASLDGVEIRRRLGERLPEYMVPSVVVELETFPLTANGKLDRRALPEPSGDRPRGGEYVAPRTAVEELLCGIWSRVLGVERVGVEDNFFSLGGDSILSIQIVSQARQAGLELSVQQIFRSQTVGSLAGQVSVREGVEEEAGSGAVALTPIQEWFFEQGQSEPWHFNQSVLLRVPAGVSAELVESALTELVGHHDALRLRFKRSVEGKWEQAYSTVEAAGGVLLERVDMRGRGGEAWEREASRLQRSLHLEGGPLLRAGWFELDEQQVRLLLVIHHLVVDGVSWRILLEDLQQLCRPGVSGEGRRLPARSSSYGRWSLALQEYAGSEALQRESGYWSEVEQGEVVELPCDRRGGENRVSTSARAHVQLNEEETRELLQEVPRAYRTQIQEVLLTALGRSLCRWSGGRSLYVELEGHGREEIFAGVDISRTVGWFTTIYPVHLRLTGGGIGEDLKAVKEQLRSVPGRGLGYGVLRYLDRSVGSRRAEVVFNYLGQFDQVLTGGSWQRAGETRGAERGAGGHREHLLSVNSMISDGCLHASWEYSAAIHEASTMQQLGEGWAEELRALLAHCRASEGGYTPSDFPLVSLSQAELDRLTAGLRLDAMYSLSPMQQGILFHTLGEPGSGVYVVQMSVELEDLSPAALRESWEEVTRRHSVLRTRFIHRKRLGEPLQAVESRVELSWSEQDWRGASEAEQQRRLGEYLRADRARGFDVGQAPLMRFMLLRLGESRFQMVWSHHHLLLDGWSVPLLLSEVMRYYEGYRSGKVIRLPQPRPYADYIGWLQKQDMVKAESYWREQLGGFSAATRLGVERSDGGTGAGGIGEYTVRLSAEASARIERLAQQQRITLNTLVQGAWGLLLSRYSGQPDVIFGATTAGRPAELAGVEQMVGLFINTLPVRVQFRPGQTVLAYLQKLQEQQAEARRYEYTPLVQIQSWSEIPRGQSLFESILVFENYPVDSIEKTFREASADGLHALARTNIEQNNYPLTAAVVPGTELSLRLSYASDLYEGATVERMAGHWLRLLEEMASDPEKRVGELEMVSDAERFQVVEEWNRTEREYPRDRGVHELFEEQVRQRPSAVAVVCGEQELSYGELNERANRLGHYLRELGVGPEVRVGLCVERSVEMVVGLLGILKAGGAYVPLDPEYPVERLGYMLEDTSAAVLLTQERLRDKLPSSWAQVVSLDEEWGEIAERSGENVSVTVSGENAAYVIYTSGSTGKPKGVVVSHGGGVNLATAQVEAFGIDVGSGVAQFASIGFDASFSEWSTALVSGGRLVLGEGLRREAVGELQQLMERGRVRVATVPPSTLMAMSEEKVAGLETLVVAGEACSVDLVRSWSAGRRMLNAYGPTETTVCATISDELGVDGASPIGRPIANTRVYVLDERMEPVGIGMRGEMYIGGAGVARGYLNRAELTAERFVPDPFASGGGRLYRTGDVGRWRADGVLEFLGRIDEQVKVRGYRIEPGEVEAVLRRQRGVRDAVVVAREGESGQKRLVGYVVGEAGASLDGVEIRRRLGERLPEYMVPSVVVELETFPLTANGKLDRRALPEPSGDRPRGGEYVAPRTAVEELLCGIWSRVLGVERVGVEDNFFSLGGHSLLATQVIARVRQVFGVEVELRRLFESPTVSGLTGVLEAAQSRGEVDKQPPLLRVEDRAELPLSYAQQRLWFIDQLEPGSVAYNIPVAVRLEGKLDEEALERTLGAIVERHEVLRTRFVVGGDGRGMQRIEERFGRVLERVDFRGLREWEQAVRMEAAEEARRGFDLGEGPLLRARLLRTGEQSHVLLLTMHHIVSDGWSTGVLIGEVGRLYEAYAQGGRAELPELAVQYGDYAVWQREWLQGEVLERQLRYWREQLSGVPVLELPTDYVRPAEASHRGGSIRVEVPSGLTEKLGELSRQEGVTLFMVLLAGFQVMLSRWSGQQDVSVGTPVANRSRTELEGLIGFFVNTLVLRTEVGGEPSVRELLGRVREVCLGAYGHQDVPFERLVEELNPERDMGHAPLFQALLALQNAPMSAIELPGLRIASLGSEAQAAKFDLELNLSESEGCIRGSFIYASDLYEATTVERMAGHWLRLLEGMATDPEKRVGELEMVSDAERFQVVEEWNRTEREYPRDRGVHELFEEQVRQRPSAVAVVCGEQELSYGELNERANRLGHYLRELGVGPEVRVGLCVERSVEMVVGLLGILKAGGAYVPLDPEYPVERLGYMLEDTSAAVLLTQAELRHKLPDYGGKVVSLDEEWGEIAERSGENVTVTVSGENAAYVIYTSGSTGKPKGVVVSHRGGVNLATAQVEAFGIDVGSGVAQFASIGFDASFSEWSTALVSGGRLVLGEGLRREAVGELQQLMERGRVRVATVPPSTLMAMSEEKVAGLETLVVAGEACSVDLVRSWSAGRRMLNAYGPTETTVCATISDELGVDGASPIGRPIANTRVYVLDERMEPVGIGMRGEMYIGGAGVARGYLNRAELTAERFVPDPFASGGERLYRTGDVGRWRADGVLEFLGRIDEQVKVRGYRIEPGEVEAVLRQQRGVRDAVVVAREGESGQKRLVGYVVGEAGASLDGVEIRRRLGERLPEYMVPSVVVELETFPLTANGKLDRRALPEPSGDRPRGGEYVAPRTAVEELLCGIWSRVLGVERVGVEDNFFSLGGDSILSIQIVSQARQAGLELSVQQIFRSQTVGSLAGQVSVREGVEEEAGSGAVALTPIQEWFFEQGQSEPWHFNQSVLLRVPAGVSAELVESALTELVGHHDALRLRFKRSVEGKWEQAYSTVEAAGGVLLERVDMRGRGGEAWEREASRLQRSLHLEGGPLLRAGWFELDEQQVRLLLVIHHLVVDGVSWRILLEDLQQLCRPGVSGEGRRLPARSSSYGRWSLALQEYAGSEALQRESGYWSEVEQGEVVELPCDRRGGENRVSTSARAHVQLNEEETRELLQEVPRAYRTQIQEVLLTALGRSLCRWSGGRSLYVELEGHGREEIFAGVDISRTVGWFTTIYPVHLRLTGGGIGEDLKAVKEQLRSVPGRGLGYGVLRYLDRSVGSRRAEVVFNYLGQFDQVLTGGSWQRAGETRGAERGAGGHREHLLSVNSMISDGCLHASWEYSAAIHEASTMQQLGEGWAEELRALLAHCRASEGGYTPSDFPLVSSLSSDELEELVAELRSTEKAHRNGDL